MRIPPAKNRTWIMIGSLAFLSAVQAQTQAPLSASYDSFEEALHLEWESTSNRTYFPQTSLDLDQWDYIGALHFGPGVHTGTVETNAEKLFYRLQYSDLPVATEEEAGTADFDLDGLQNLFELQESHTNPLGSDTDNDNLPDGWEVAHSISPLDDGSIDPQNGPDGVFPSSPGEGLGVLSVTTNADAFAAGVQAHPNANFRDYDGDGILNEIDAGPLSRAIDWKTNGTPPFFFYAEIPGYNSVPHGNILACNNNGDVIAERALYSDGVWNLLADAPTGPDDSLPLSVQVEGRTHRAYIVGQPTATSVADDGTIVGTGTVLFEPVEEEVTPNHWVTYELPPTTFAFIWDSWNVTPRILAHSPDSTLAGCYWNEYAQISSDNVILIRQRAQNLVPTGGGYRFLRISEILGKSGSTNPYEVNLSAATGEQGIQAFNTGFSNGFCWLPDDGAPHSVLAESNFKTPNARTFFGAEPTYIGVKPGLPGGYCLNFWNKAMIRHEDRWQEAVELGDATLITTKGVAFRSRIPTSVQLWKGGQVLNLTDVVPNKNFASLSVFPLDSTADGRVLINYYGVTEPNSYGFLVPAEIEEVISDQIAGNEINKLPSAYFGGHSNNPMLMATRSGTDARLAIKVNVNASYASSIRVGVRVKDQTTIIDSVPAVASPAKTLLAFVAQNGSKTYEVVAGFDTNGNSVLDPDEAKIPFLQTPMIDSPGRGGGPYSGDRPDLSDKIIIVTEDDCVEGRMFSEGYGENPLYTAVYPIATDLIGAFAVGATVIPGSGSPTLGVPLDASVIPSPDGLSHPLGGKWNALGQTTTHRLNLPVGSALSNKVTASEGIQQMYGRVLTANQTTLQAAATGDWTTVAIAFADDDIDFSVSDRFEEVHVTLGKCGISGTLQVSLKSTPGGGFEVAQLNCQGSIVDLYDWSYGGEVVRYGLEVLNPKYPARTQAGYATLASSPWPEAGRVFFNHVEIGTGWFDYEATF